MEKLPGKTFMKTATKSTCPQAGVSCFAGQDSDEFEVRSFLESSLVISPA